MPFYFAFGSNMDPKRMHARAVAFTSREHAFLADYALAFNKKATYANEGYANVIRCPGTVVEGVLYHVTKHGLNTLDRYEGVPFNYDRVHLNVRRENGKMVPAIVYVANPARTAKNLRPTADYMRHILAASALLSPSYVSQLKAIQTMPARQRWEQASFTPVQTRGSRGAFSHGYSHSYDDYDLARNDYEEQQAQLEAEWEILRGYEATLLQQSKIVLDEWHKVKEFARDVEQQKRDLEKEKRDLESLHIALIESASLADAEE